MDRVDTWSDEGPICPYCGYQHNEPEDVCFLLTNGEDGEDATECEKCQKEFKYNVEATTSYTYNSIAKN